MFGYGSGGQYRYSSTGNAAYSSAGLSTADVLASSGDEARTSSIARLLTALVDYQQLMYCWLVQVMRPEPPLLARLLTGGVD
jgi:hypothetical protein